MTDTIEAQQREMWDAYTAHEYEKALAIALALGPKQDNGLRSLLEHHVQREQARARAQRDVDTLPESDVRHLVSRARLLLLDVPSNALAGPSTDPRLGDALGYLDRALTIEPDNVDAIGLRWSAQTQRGEKPAAHQAARRLAALQPTAKSLLRLAADTDDRFERFVLLMAAGKAGGAPAAVAMAWDSFVIDPPDAMSEVALEEMADLAELDEYAGLLWGRRLRDAGRTEDAIAIWRQSLADSSVRMELEDLYRALGRDAEADALLEDE